MFSFPVPSHFPAYICAIVRTDPSTLVGERVKLHAEVRFWTFIAKSSFLAGYDAAFHAEIDRIQKAAYSAYSAA